MADYIYNERGEAQGFRQGYFLYRLDGKPVGRVSAERVYGLDGEYVGELFKNMVVEKPVRARRRLPPVPAPPDTKPLAGHVSRVRTSYGFQDVFHRLSAETREPAAASHAEG